VQDVELRLGIEEIELAGCSLHEEEDAVFRLGSKVRGLRFEGIGEINARFAGGMQESGFLHQGGEGQSSQAAGAGGQKAASGLLDPFFLRIHRFTQTETERCNSKSNKRRLFADHELFKIEDDSGNGDRGNEVLDGDPVCGF